MNICFDFFTFGKKNIKGSPCYVTPKFKEKDLIKRHLNSERPRSTLDKSFKKWDLRMQI